ncbi:MAG: hypothetical protein ACYTEL_10865 [Planctomycetota bacterium]|jgi:hypothetical protein
MQENLRARLLDEWLERLRTGEDVDTREYLERYQGDKQSFRLELNLARILMGAGKKRTDQWSKMVASGEVRRRRAAVLKSLRKEKPRKA